MDKTLAALEKHLTALKSTRLGDEPGPKLNMLPKCSDPFSSFNTVVDEYNQAISNSIIHLRRYERSLYAWKQVLNSLDNETKETVSADYIAPVLHLACDLPLIIKEQIVHCSVKLTVLANNEGSVSEYEQYKQNSWFQHLQELLASKNNKGDALLGALGKLWNTESAKQLRERHGKLHHDIERPLIGNKPFVTEPIPGCTLTGFELPLDLSEDIPAIDEQRLYSDAAYSALVAYISSLVEATK